LQEILVKALALMVVGTVAAVLLCATLPIVQAADDASGLSPDTALSTALSFDPGTVRFGYADGYWDNDHHWHGWPSAREAREFHRRFHDRIYGYRHTRYPNEGWRDGDGRN
jgi:hypothetical protein